MPEKTAELFHQRLAEERIRHKPPEVGTTGKTRWALIDTTKRLPEDLQTVARRLGARAKLNVVIVEVRKGHRVAFMTKREKASEEADR